MRRTSWVLCLLLLLPTACQVPSVQPFATATAAMSTALTASLGQVAGDFQRLDSLDAQSLTGPQLDSLARYQQQLAAATAAFGGVARALNDYASSLVAIAAARQQGDQRLDALTAAIGKLATAAGPWGRALGLAAAPAEAIIKDLAAVHTLRLLHAKVTAQDSAVQQLARYLASGIARFGRLDAAAIELYANNVAGQYYPVVKYYRAAQLVQAQALAVLQNAAELRATRYRLQTAPTAAVPDLEADLRATAQELARRDPPLRRAAARHPPGTDEAYYTELNQREAFYKQRLIDPQLLALYQNAQGHLAAFPREARQNQALLAQCAATLLAWARSHQALQLSLEHARRHPPAQEMLDQAQLIQQAVAGIEALKLRAVR